MAITAHVYGQFAKQLALKTMNLSTDTIKVALATSSYTPNQASDTFASTPLAFETSGTGYTTGGVALSSVVITDTGNVYSISAANTSWPAATFTARYAIIYDSTPGTYATDPLIGYVDFGANQSPSGVTFEIDWAGGVVLSITAT